MGNIGTTIKRFLSNKNTVTLIAIIACTVIITVIYNYRVNNAIKTTYACYAVQTIPARSKITKEMVDTVKILSSQVSDNMITDCSKVINKYASYAMEIPQNSFFYNTSVMKEDEMPDSAFDDIPDGNTLFSFPVTFESTYGNSIFPGDYIDLYLQTEDPTTELPIFGKFIQSIKVLGVKDENGKNVFETTVEARVPSQLLFSVPEDLFLLLKKSQILGIHIDIVPRNNNYTAKEGTTLVSSAYLKELIIDQTAEIPDECVTQETGTAECPDIVKPNDENNTENKPAEQNNKTE